MGSWWGGMSGAQAVQMGQNIFNLAQQQEQQKMENFFTRMQLNIQKENLDLNRARQELELEEREKRAKREDVKAQQEQERLQKITEYSQGLSQMIDALDFSSPDDMKKLYAFQSKYQPYGVTPKYLKPEIPKEIEPISQKDYSNLVFKTWNELKDYIEKKYKDDLASYENLGFWGRRRRDAHGNLPVKPELELPTLEDAKKLTDEMLRRGETIDDVLKPQPPQPQPFQPQPPQPQQQFVSPQSPYAGAGKLFDMFSPSKRKYNALPAAEKRIVDRYMADSGASLDETLQMLEEAKAMKMQ